MAKKNPLIDFVSKDSSAQMKAAPGKQSDAINAFIKYISPVITSAIQGASLPFLGNPQDVGTGVKESTDQMTNYSKDAGAGLAMNQVNPGVSSSSNAAIDMANKAYSRAQTVKDPAEKARLLKVANDTLSTVGDNAQDLSSSFSPDVQQNPYLRGGITAANIGLTADMASSVGERGVKAINDALEIGKAQPGGLQAGFAKIPGKGDLPEIKPPSSETADYVRNPDTGNLVKNPKANKVSAKPVEGQYPEGFTPSENKPSQVAPQVKTSGQKPYPEVADEPTDMMNDRVNKHPLTRGNPVLVDLRDEAKKNPYYLDDQSRSRFVMDHYVPGNTAVEIEQNLPRQLQEETKRIQNIIGDDAEKVKITDLTAKNEANMRAKGIAGGMNDKGEQATTQLITKLYDQIGEGPQAEVGGRDLLKFKQKLDNQLQPVYKSLDNGATYESLSPADRASLTFRKTLDDQITELYPKTKEALQRQSGMIDARPSVAKAAGAEEVAGTKAAQEAADMSAPTFTDRLKGLSKNPVASATIGGLVTTGGVLGGPSLVNGATVAGQELFNYINKGSQKDSSNEPAKGQVDNPSYYNRENGLHISDQSVSQGNKNSNRYSLDSDPIKTGQLLDTSTYANTTGDLQKKIDTEKYTDPQAASQDQGQLDALTTKWNSQGDLRKAWTDPDRGYGNVLEVGNQTASAVKDAGPDFYNALNQGYDKLRTASSGKYAQMAKYLQYLGQATGTDFTQFKSKDALLGALDSTVQGVSTQWSTLQKQYSGGEQPQSAGKTFSNYVNPPPTAAPTPIQWPQGGFSTRGGSSLTGNPSLDTILSAGQ